MAVPVLPLAGAALRYLASRGLSGAAFATGSRTLGRGATRIGNIGKGAHAVRYASPTATRGKARFIAPGIGVGALGGLAGYYASTGGTGMSAEEIFENMNNDFGPTGRNDALGGAGGFPTMNASTMAASTMTPNFIDFNMAAPQNPSGMLSNAAKRAYQPTIDYAQSVIPYYENREEASKGEIQDLRNIAEASWVDTAGRIREGTEAAVAQENAARESMIAQLAEGTEGAVEANKEFLGGVSNVEETGKALKGEGAAREGLAAAEGSIFSSLIGEEGLASADYADTLAGLQDTAAAADIALLRQNMSELIFRQQGRISEAQQAQAVAMMQAALQGQQMYQQAYNQYTGMAFDAARTNASLAQEAAKFNASSQAEAAQFNAAAQNRAAEFNASAELSALSGGGSGSLEMGEGFIGAINNTKQYMAGAGWNDSDIDTQVNAFANARAAVLQNYANNNQEPNEQLLIRDMQAVLQNAGVQYDPNAFQVFVNSGM